MSKVINEQFPAVTVIIADGLAHRHRRDPNGDR